MRTYKKQGVGGKPYLQSEDASLRIPSTVAGAGGVNSLYSRGVTEDVELPKELTPVTSHSIAFVVATLRRPG